LNFRGFFGWKNELREKVKKHIFPQDIKKLKLFALIFVLLSQFSTWSSLLCAQKPAATSWPHHRAASRQFAVLANDPLNGPHVNIQTLRKVLVMISRVPQGHSLPSLYLKYFYT
jgi:hypothetical protein